MTVEERAAYYRAQCAARVLYEKARQAALAGDDDLAAEVAADWEPLAGWLRERDVTMPHYRGPIL